MPQKIKRAVIIKSANASIRVESEGEAILARIKRDPFLRKYIPSCEIILGSKNKADCKLIIKRSRSFGVELTYPMVRCFETSRADVKGLISLIGYILERARSEKCAYSIHSSVICKNGKAAVIFGGTTNLGKTSVAKTAADKFGWSFYADEVAILDDRTRRVIGGVKTASGGDRFKSFALQDDRTKPKISVFIHPHIDNGLNKIEKWDPAKFFWHLKEELARKIRGGSKAINFFSYPLDSLDTSSIARKRLQFAKTLSRRVKCYEIRGTPNFIAKAIDRLK